MSTHADTDNSVVTLWGETVSRPPEQGSNPVTQTILYAVQLTEVAKDDVDDSPYLTFPCAQSEYGINRWLASDHGKRADNPGKRKLNEKNHGIGFVFICNTWFAFHVDQLKNSQFGKTTLAIIALNLETPRWHNIYAGIRIGKARITYEVPWAQQTARGGATVMYFTLGVGPVRFHVAPVPHQSHVKIFWIETNPIELYRLALSWSG